MSESEKIRKNILETSRRDFLLTTTGLAALAATPASTSAATSKLFTVSDQPTPPFDNMREYIAALDAYGLLVRIPRLDQDAYEIAALMYRLRDRFDMRGGPALLIEEIKIDGQWVKGPLLVNESGSLFGLC